MDPVLVRSLLDDLLATAVAALTPDPLDNDDPRTAPPDRQLVAHGDFAWDCELVAVRLDRLGLDRPPGQPNTCAVVPVATVSATVLRCYPKAGDGGEEIPSAEAIDTAARVLAVDAAALADGIATSWADGSLFDPVPCSRVTIVPGVEPLGPDGGLAGWRVTLDVRL